MQQTLELRIRKIAQAASGGSHVTIYKADVQLTAGTVRVDVAGVEPRDTAPEDVEAARAAIHRGAENVLIPMGLGADIRVRRIVIHPVDFKPHQFERYTAEEFRRMLADNPG